MSERFHFPASKFFLLVIIFCSVFFSTNTFLYAETCSDSQTPQVTLAWDANNPTPEGYQIYQRIEGQSYDYSQPVWTTTNSTATICNLDFSTNYYFVVRAYTGDDQSGDSNEISFVSSPPLPSPSTTYTIATSNVGNGSISPVGTVEVTESADQTFEISPGTGSYIVDVFVDGVSVGAVSTYTFNQVLTNHTISAEFAYSPHSITATSGMGGSISPSGEATVEHGASQGYTITPSAGYLVNDVVVDGISMGPLTSFVFDPVVQDHIIHATFAPYEYTISSTADSNGTITPSGNTTVSFGGSQVYTITPNSNCSIADVVVDGVSVGVVDSYTFSNIQGDHTISALFITNNEMPSADAGPDQTVDEGQTVALSGLNSFDADDGIATFQWRQVQGVEVVLNSPNEPETTFTAPNVDSSGVALVFELTVTDYSGATSVDTCIVNVTWINLPPVADAGVDQTVTEGSLVLLDASNSTDADDGIASYAWTHLFGPAVLLSDPNSATPTFTAPDVGLEGASISFEVTVTDEGGLQSTNTCLINVTWVNTPPVADAGPDQNVEIGDEVFLDGSQSYDDDNQMITSYMWHQTEGVPVELSDATAQSPTFLVPAGADSGGLLTFELTVTDSGGLKGTDGCQVIVQPVAPILYVSNITMALTQKGSNHQAQAYLTIVDGTGTIVKQAKVAGQWYLNGTPINLASAASRGDGNAKLESDKIKVNPGAIFTLEITGIAKDGYSYNPASNILTEQSISLP